MQNTCKCSIRGFIRTFALRTCSHFAGFLRTPACDSAARERKQQIFMSSRSLQIQMSAAQQEILDALFSGCNLLIVESLRS